MCALGHSKANYYQCMDVKKLQTIVDELLKAEDMAKQFPTILRNNAINASDYPVLVSEIAHALEQTPPRLKINEDGIVKLWNAMRAIRTEDIRKKVSKEKQKLLSLYPTLASYFDT